MFQYLLESAREREEGHNEGEEGRREIYEKGTREIGRKGEV